MQWPAHGNVNHNINGNMHVNSDCGYHGGGVYHGDVYRVAWAGRSSRWRPRAAISAGAAIGFTPYGAAVAWAPPPPEPGLCWYYTDPSQQDGFWDTCPY